MNGMRGLADEVKAKALVEPRIEGLQPTLRAAIPGLGQSLLRSRQPRDCWFGLALSDRDSQGPLLGGTNRDGPLHVEEALQAALVE